MVVRVWVGVLAVAALVGCAGQTSSSPDASSPVNGDPFPRPAEVIAGEKLAFARNCSGCHSSAAGLLAGSSAAISGAYAPNITPDMDTGIGSWTDEDLIRALRFGVDDEGATLCSQMPREPGLSDDDAAKLVAYLRSVPPMINTTPDQACSANAHDVITAGRVAAVELHCDGCHGAGLGGSDVGVGGAPVYAPNLTPDMDTGLGSWSDEQLVAAITQGVDDEGVALCTAMPRFDMLTEDQLTGLVAYLHSLAPVTHSVPESTCVRPSLDVDAGVVEMDAGTGGTVDAGSHPVDAGVVDAGVVDAGVVDAGIVDAGVVDAGSGVVDAGSGSVDAGMCAQEIVISQVYGAGGNSGAVFKNDFVELHNVTAHSVSLDGFAVQYASSSGSSWTAAPIPAGTSVPAGAFVVFSLAAGTTGAALPGSPIALTPALNLANATGKVALTRTVAALSGTCPTANSALVDFVGYGAANCSMAMPVAALSVTTAALRMDVGAGVACSVTGSNSGDFVVATPAPHSGTSSCGCP